MFKSILDKPELTEIWDREANKEHPVMVTVGSKEQMHWICELGHKFVRQVMQVDRDKYKCPQCLAFAKEGFNARNLVQDMDFEWHKEKNKAGILPERIYQESRKKYWWICESGHEFLQSPKEINEGTVRCPVCRFIALREENSLAQKHPDLVEWLDYPKNHFIPAKAIAANSRKVLHWKCLNGHQFKLNVKAMVWLKKCPVCQVATIPSIEVDL